LRINAPPPAIDLVLAPMVAPFLKTDPKINLEIVAASSLVDIVSTGFDARRALWRASRAGHDRGLAGCAAALRTGGVVAICRAAWPAKQPEDLLDHPCIGTLFASGAMWDWEFQNAGRTLKVAPPAKLIATYAGLGMKAAVDGVGFWLTFEGYVCEAIKSGALVSVLDDWCAPFPGPFLYYPSRRQLPPALAAFVAFVAEWRKQERRRAKQT
jgi:DNA-binding transcriptional LysR family regulator